MSRFWHHLRLYVRHLRHGRIPRRWPPRLIEAGRGKRRKPTDEKGWKDETMANKAY